MLGEYSLYYRGGNLNVKPTIVTVYFGSKRIALTNSSGVTTAFSPDQLGSSGQYYPYGEGKGGNNPADTWSFATYWRDSATGLDYADQRYSSNQVGRFMTADPYSGSAEPGNPQSWNRYPYVMGDPLNAFDPEGTTYCFVNPDTGLTEECFDSVDVNGSSGFAGGPSGGGGGATPQEQKGMRATYNTSTLLGNQVLSNGEQLALKWLNSPSCQALFGSGLGNPDNVLQSLLTTGSFGGGQITLTTGYIPLVSSSTLGGVTVQTPLGMLGAVVATGAAIFINSNVLPAPAGVQATNATQDVSETLIEELGHAYNDTSGSGGSTIAYDNPFVVGTTPGKTNFTNIMKACNK